MNVGNFRPLPYPPSHPNGRALIEEIHFQTHLSERDDESEFGVAVVKCLELESLRRWKRLQDPTCISKATLRRVKRRAVTGAIGDTWQGNHLAWPFPMFLGRDPWENGFIIDP